MAAAPALASLCVLAGRVAQEPRSLPSTLSCVGLRAVFTTADLNFTTEIARAFPALDANDGKIYYRHDVGGPISGR